MIIAEKHLRKLIRNMIIENNEDNQNPTSFADIYQQLFNDNSNEETEDNNTTPENNDSVNRYFDLLNPQLRQQNRQNQNNQ
tara:strand:+ start:370 stop:612 length:243 start_codon:yes stop_codon:yes gene_type:complete